MTHSVRARAALAIMRLVEVLAFDKDQLRDRRGRWAKDPRTEGIRTSSEGGGTGAGGGGPVTRTAPEVPPQSSSTAPSTGPVQLDRNGLTWTLKNSATRGPGTAINTGDTIQDASGDDFVITGVDWNPLMDEREPVLVGFWPSLGETADDADEAPASNFPDIRWTWLANN